MKIKKETLRGYILEEVVAHLLRNAGYRLLTHPNQDPNSLAWERHGLVVHGRGTTHQADALGQRDEVSLETGRTFVCRMGRVNKHIETCQFTK